MTIAIIGAGAIGSVVASYLHKAGVDVTLVCKEEQLEALQTNGIHIKGVRGEETFKVPVVSQLDKEYNLVIFTVKSQDLERSYSHNCEFLENSLVLSSQNGVQADNILSSHFERKEMFSSIVMFGSTYHASGEITFNFEGDWIIGRPFQTIDPKTHEIAQLLGKAFNTVVTDHIMGMKWLKLFVNFNNCIPAMVGQSMQETFADMDMCRLSILLLKEGLDIVTKGGAKLVSLPNFPAERIQGLASMPMEQAAGIINKTLTTLSKEPLYGSILQSIKRKRDSEIDFINGEVVWMAKQMQTTAPLNENVVDIIHEIERSNQFLTFEEVKDKFELHKIGVD
ncbi:MAG: ketopantoate reductase family protein [Candidatus Omnitrophica bacterium]|nr:ketopantoate reductase family protein [Candidatus Omnitrophota bacterium]